MYGLFLFKVDKMMKFDKYIDVEIKDLIFKLNKIKGVSTWSSCQGKNKNKPNLKKEHNDMAFIMFNKLPSKYISKINKSKKLRFYMRELFWKYTFYKPKRLRSGKNDLSTDYVVESRYSKNNHLFQQEIKSIFEI